MRPATDPLCCLQGCLPHGSNIKIYRSNITVQRIIHLVLVAKTRSQTEVEPQKEEEGKVGRQNFSPAPRGFTWQVREYILFFIDPQGKEWERPKWWNLSYFFGQPMVTLSNGLNVLCCPGDQGEQEWRESGSTPLSENFSILPGTSVSSPVPLKVYKGSGKIPFVLAKAGNVGRGKKSSP